MSHWIIVITLVLSGAAAQQSTTTGTLVVTEKSTGYELMVPMSSLVLTIPKGELAPAKLIDLHLSVTGRQSEEEGRSRMRKLLGTMTVTER